MKQILNWSKNFNIKKRTKIKSTIILERTEEENNKNTGKCFYNYMFSVASVVEFNNFTIPVRRKA